MCFFPTGTPHRCGQIRIASRVIIALRNGDVTVQMQQPQGATKGLELNYKASQQPLASHSLCVSALIPSNEGPGVCSGKWQPETFSCSEATVQRIQSLPSRKQERRCLALARVPRNLYQEPQRDLPNATR